jgi:hypothetical protein
MGSKINQKKHRSICNKSEEIKKVITSTEKYLLFLRFRGKCTAVTEKYS